MGGVSGTGYSAEYTGDAIHLGESPFQLERATADGGKPFP